MPPTADTKNLHFYQLGTDDAPSVVILHGLFGSGTNWRKIAQILSEQFQVWVPDLRNHGKSFHEEHMSWTVMAEDVLAWMDSQKLDRVTLLGHSMGGKVGMRLACQHPERIQALIVADIAPIAYAMSAHQQLIQSLLKLNLQIIHRREDADALLTHDIPSSILRTFLLTNLKHGSQGLEWKIPLNILAQALPGLRGIPECQTPYPGKTLFIGGEQSDYIPKSSYPEIKRLFPAYRMVILKQCGHWLHVEQPEAFLQTVKTFLRHHLLSGE
ncbi:MAG: alpha/beta fold hydrolase [SAR324 cluster bacterium]|nr:alpha/beta fold hydrolase [SAR324 cluster bacterium]